MITADDPMVRVMDPDKPGLAYDCSRCGFVEVVPEPGFLRGHDICPFCFGRDGILVRLQYLDEMYYPPTLVWEGDYA